jgi:hypothetical protein
MLDGQEINPYMIIPSLPVLDNSLSPRTHIKNGNLSPRSVLKYFKVNSSKKPSHKLIMHYGCGGFLPQDVFACNWICIPHG